MSRKDRNENNKLLSDALFGSPEEMDITEALETLADAGLEPGDLCNKMYEKMCAVAQEFRLRKEEVPPLLRKAIADLRPASLPARTQAELDKRADSVISRIVEAVRSSLTLPDRVSSLALSQSFRLKKSEKSVTDQRIIDRLETQLLKDLASEGEKD
jgi:hypothetical protein